MNKLDELPATTKPEHALITAKKNDAPILHLYNFNFNEIILLTNFALEAKSYA